MAALIDRATLLRPITRRMRQRAFVILNPCQIAGIKPSAALVAAEIVLALVERRSTDTHAHPAPARPRLSIVTIAVMCTSQKNQPRFPEADSHAAHGAPPAMLPSWFDIVTVIAAVKPADRRAHPARAFCLDGFALARAAFERLLFS
jgi:hypothetical protein